jgi:hypothetical protein
MRALTLWRPWPGAIFSLPPARAKDVENRTWVAPWIVGEPVAIHAGQHVDRSAFDYIERVAGVRPPEDGGALGIVGVVVFDAMLASCDSPWFIGPVGWQIAKQQALLEPVPCRGNRKLWNLPTDIEGIVQRRLRAAIRKGRK